MKLKTLGLLLAGSIALAGCGQSIDAGEVGLIKRYGKVDADPATSGWVWYNPWSTDIVTMNTRAQKWTGQKDTSTHDIQRASVVFTATYQMDASRATEVYTRFGKEWAARVMPQIIYDAIGNEFGKWDAVKIIEQRDKVQKRIYDRIAPRLAAAHIQLLSLDLIKIGYNKEFMDSVEAKQIAIQEGIKSQNQTVQVENESKQRVIRAEAEAKSIQLQSSALQASPSYVQMKAVEKWNGQLPVNMYGSQPVPFVGSQINK